jgi:hypothetical protein
MEKRPLPQKHPPSFRITGKRLFLFGFPEQWYGFHAMRSGSFGTLKFPFRSPRAFATLSPERKGAFLAHLK